MIDVTLQLQQPDGSWIAETKQDDTGVQLLFIDALKLLYPEHIDELQTAINRAKPYLLSKYKTTSKNGKTVGYFDSFERGNLYNGISSSVSAGLTEGDAEPLFDSLYESITE